MKSLYAGAIVCSVLFAPTVSFAQAAPGDETQPIKPGAVRITTKPPDLDKWDNGTKSPNGLQRTFKCKPLACSDAEIVVFTFLKSPTRHPDPQALDKFAKVELPKNVRAMDAAREIMTDGAEKIETLSSDTATLKNYPAVLNETRLSRGNTSAYVELAIIFAGPVMIRVQSTSANQELAKNSLKSFIDLMSIQEGPPLPATPPPQQLPPVNSPAGPQVPQTRGT
jgi:hypothetical protein